MEKATISELKNGLSAYLKRVAAGGTVLILDRDRPVAKLERVAPAADVGGRLQRLESAGLVRRAEQRLSLDALRATEAQSEADVLGALIEERRDSR